MNILLINEMFYQKIFDIDQTLLRFQKMNKTIWFIN